MKNEDNNPMWVVHEVGVRWNEFNRKGELVTKEKFFASTTQAGAEKRLDAFAAKVQDKANFNEFLAWTGC